jgi:hypothetical protein
LQLHIVAGHNNVLRGFAICKSAQQLSVEQVSQLMHTVVQQHVQEQQQQQQQQQGQQ